MIINCNLHVVHSIDYCFLLPQNLVIIVCQKRFFTLQDFLSLESFTIIPSTQKLSPALPLSLASDWRGTQHEPRPLYSCRHCCPSRPFCSLHSYVQPLMTKRFLARNHGNVSCAQPRKLFIQFNPFLLQHPGNKDMEQGSTAFVVLDIYYCDYMLHRLRSVGNIPVNL